MKEKWDERYSSDEYAYGTHPNEYFKSKLISISTGTFDNTVTIVNKFKPINNIIQNHIKLFSLPIPINSYKI